MTTEESGNGAIRDNADFRLGLAYRPHQSRWTFLNRSDLIFAEQQDATFNTRTRKWVNNFSANFKSASHVESNAANLQASRYGRHQLALQFGAKYVVDTIDEREFDGFTVLYGGQYRYNLSPRWDLGAQAAAHHSLKAKVIDYSAGLSVGFNPYKNMWLSLGYNFAGFEDEDFVAAEYTAEGPYLKLRIKFDEHLAKQFLDFVGLKGPDTGSHYSNSR